MTCTNMYVDELLVLHFPDLLSYVKKAEHAAASRSLPEGQLPPGFGVIAAEPVIRDFAARWITAIESLHRCAPFKNDTESSFTCLKVSGSFQEVKNKCERWAWMNRAVDLLHVPACMAWVCHAGR